MTLRALRAEQEKSWRQYLTANGTAATVALARFEELRAEELRRVAKAKKAKRQVKQ